MTQHTPNGGRGARERLVRAALLPWYRRTARDLPWRRTRDPYAVWVSETMLQQTRVETVLPYFARFLEELPDVAALAEAPEERVLALWSGLGYYRRARMLHAAARAVVLEHQGKVPGTSDRLRLLPGVGAYTAGAIASIAFGEPAALVDGNVARVLARLYCVKQDVKSAAGSAALWALAEELIEGLSPDEGTPGEWNQALMELGATVCTPRAPACDACPVARVCLAKARAVVESLPCTAPRRAPRLVRRVALVMASETAVVLARRRPEALFGGLWEPPCADGAGRAQVVALARALGVDPRTARVAGSVEHVLSHRRLEVEVAVAPLGRRRTWPVPGPDYDAVDRVPLDDLSEGRRPHATLTRKLLGAAGVARLAKAPRRGVRSTSR